MGYEDAAHSIVKYAVNARKVPTSFFVAKLNPLTKLRSTNCSSFASLSNVRDARAELSSFLCALTLTRYRQREIKSPTSVIIYRAHSICEDTLRYYPQARQEIRFFSPIPENYFLRFSNDSLRQHYNLRGKMSKKKSSQCTARSTVCCVKGKKTIKVFNGVLRLHESTSYFISSGGRESVEVGLNRKPSPEQQLLLRRFTWPTFTRRGQDNFLVSVQMLASDKKRFRVDAYCFPYFFFFIFFERRNFPTLFIAFRSGSLDSFRSLLSIFVLLLEKIS
ncbi:hypothetical protein PUN28_018195 [Cardiocondyla obscurior]|uniref:Uncharacterized protein n=1 Tax=Cardiocondyla obscurior TaxID=286306 RepID=A0AAW2EHT1_9HYME